MTVIAFIAGILATWRVTHLVVEEDGPLDVFRRLRTLLGRLGSCFLCASVWLAVPVALLLVHGWRDVLIAIAAFSGGAILLQRLAPEVRPAEWIEEKEEPS
jgi:hypothetical protein